jgi:DNA-directed RNA polymerase subunit RPC12/RpoP
MSSYSGFDWDEKKSPFSGNVPLKHEGDNLLSLEHQNGTPYLVFRNKDNNVIFDEKMNRLVFEKKKPIMGPAKIVISIKGHTTPGGYYKGIYFRSQHQKDKILCEFAPTKLDVDYLLSLLNKWQSDSQDYSQKWLDKEGRFWQELEKRMTHQQITTYDEILELHKETLGELLPKPTDELITKIIDHQLEPKYYKRKKIGGLNDIPNRRFVNKFARVSETIEYKIAATFDLTSSGTISLKCPNCGAASPIESKSNENICAYCGSKYIVPKKILELV